MVEMAHTYTIILPIDKRKCKRLAELLEMFRQNAIVQRREVERIMPRATLNQLLYTLSLVERQVFEKYGFRLFEFRWVKREDGSRFKVMEPATEMELADVEGMRFVTFTKTMEGGKNE